MKKINIAELLKDCPTGMELDCTMYDNLYFDSLNADYYGTINCYTLTDGIKTSIKFTKYGTFNNHIGAKCVIFPKGKTTWEGFVPPEFKDGDILVGKVNQPFIFQSFNWARRSCFSYCGIDVYERFQLHSDDWTFANSLRFATEKEKEKLFKTIQNNGYKWNAKTKTLEKLVEPKFHKGDWVTDGINKYQIHFIDDTQYWYSENCILGSIESVDKQYHLWTINDAKDGDVLFHSDSASNGIFIFKEILQCGTLQKVICYCDYDSEDGFCLGENHTCCWADSKILYPATKERCDRLFQKMKKAGYEWVAETKTLVRLIQPKFKIGDKVIHKNNHNVIFTITNIENDYYICRAKKMAFGFSDQDNYELVDEPKFNDGDILTNYRGSIYIYKGPMNYNKNLADFYCGYRRADHAFVLKYVKGIHFGDINECHLASEEDKTKLFQIMKRNGYKWNSETKILEKLIAPKFKVGDRIKYKNGIEQGVILSITDNTYDVAVTNNIGISVRIIDQDEWELIPNKFDINTLIPFESKVLVRHNKDNKWTGSFFSFIDRDLHSHCYKFVTTADKSYPMMIPYKGNEHLLGKVEDCKDFYKIWE